MFEKIKAWWKKKHEETPIDKRIRELTEEMSNFHGDSNEYQRMSENLKTLSEAKQLIEHKCNKIDGNVIFNGIMALAQVILILIWEERHVIRSTATKFITKLFTKH